MVGWPVGHQRRFIPVDRVVLSDTLTKLALRCATLMATGGCRFFSYATWRSISIFDSLSALPHIAAAHDNPASACTTIKKRAT